jgi:hypothetical protein
LKSVSFLRTMQPDSRQSSQTSSLTITASSSSNSQGGLVVVGLGLHGKDSSQSIIGSGHETIGDGQ